MEGNAAQQAVLTTTDANDRSFFKGETSRPASVPGGSWSESRVDQRGPSVRWKAEGEKGGRVISERERRVGKPKRRGENKSREVVDSAMMLRVVCAGTRPTIRYAEPLDLPASFFSSSVL
jgi:hypothetical protein